MSTPSSTPSGTGRHPALRTVTERPGLGPVVVAVDVVLVALCCLVSLTALASAYGGRAWLVAGAGGVLAGLLVAGVSSRLRLAPWPTALLLVAAYLLTGSAAAAPRAATYGLLPNADTLRLLVTGAVRAWRDSLTTFTPLGSVGDVLVVPFALCLLAACAAGLLLWRAPRPGLAVVPLALHLLACAAFGDQLAGFSLVRGLAVLVLLLAWSQWRGVRQSPARWVRRAALAAALLGVAGVAGAGVATATAGVGARAVLRDHVTPPFDPQDYKSPLSKYRAYVKDLRTADLFSYTGAPERTRVRLAVLDRWDGLVWNVSGGPGQPAASGTFTRAPRQLPGDGGSSTAGSGGASTFTVRIEKYTGPWVPSIGLARSITVSGPDAARQQSGLLINKATGTVAEVGGVRQGSTYTFRTAVSRQPSTARVQQADRAAFALPARGQVPEGLTRTTQGWVAKASGDTAGAAAVAIEKAFRNGFYSDGKASEYPSDAGHGYARLADLFGEHMVGDGEQYAAAMALALQQQSIPARVVLGFDTKAASGTVTGDDVLAWVEVKLQGLGWVELSPTPDKKRQIQKQQDQPNPEPQPQVLQPPDVPQDPQQNADDVGRGKGSVPDTSSFAWLGVALKVLLGLLLLALLTAPIWLVLLIKSVRHRRRREHPDLVTSMSGGWREITDEARDLGVRLPVSSTRYETSVVLAGEFPQAAVAPLGVIADRHVFGAVDPTPEEIEAYWRDVATVCHDMRAGVPRWRRWAAALSLATFDLRSLPRRTTSRVAALASRLRPAWLHLPEPLARHTRAARQRLRVARARRRRSGRS